MGNPRQRRKMKNMKGRVKTSGKAKRHKSQPQRGRVQVLNKTVAAGWDPSKTLRENFDSIGLTLDPNSDIKSKRAGPLKQLALSDAIEEGRICPDGRVILDSDLRDADDDDGAAAAAAVPARTAIVAELEEQAANDKPRVSFAARGEVLFVQRLIEKHGTDYKAMARDHELNYNQHTAKQIKRKCQKYLETLELVNKVADKGQHEA